MIPLNAGLVIPRGRAGQLVERAQQAEQRGVPAIWTTVGGPSADSVGGLTAAAAVTDRVVLGTAVTPVYGRHPITLAAEALAINDLAPGRVRLGIGSSHRPIIEDMYGIPMVKPLASRANSSGSRPHCRTVSRRPGFLSPSRHCVATPLSWPANWLTAPSPG
jgi:alkanesulfonate monooxygenase SsuD/methylene tetrahydromethanopterin reductase-like flavin-dependent oxidoreductase (luciferase family)